MLQTHKSAAELLATARKHFVLYILHVLYFYIVVRQWVGLGQHHCQHINQQQVRLQSFGSDATISHFSLSSSTGNL